MNYIASVKDPDTNTVVLISKDCFKTKKEFAICLRENGYRVRFITTEEKFDEDCNKYHLRVDRTNRMNKFKRQAERETAERLGMTVRQFRSFNKGLNEYCNKYC